MIDEIRRDEAIRELTWWLILGPFLTWTLGLLLTATLGRWLFGLDVYDAPSAARWLFWSPWLPVALYLARRRRRASELALALPLPARRLWLGHALALGLGGAAILAVSATLATLEVARLAPGADDRMIPGALRLAAGLVIAVPLLESSRPAFTPTRASFFLVAAVLIGVPALVLRLDGGWVVVLMGLALAAGFRTWRSLPAALILEPAVDDSAARPGAAPPQGVGETRAATRRRQPSERRRHLVFLARTFLRIQSASPEDRFLLYFLLYPCLVLLGLMLMEGVTGMFVIPLLAVFLLVPAARMTLSHLAMLDPLPVSRRLVFAAMVIPSFAALSLGCGIGVTVRLAISQPAVREPAAGQIPIEAIFATALILTAALWLCLTALFLRFPNSRYTSGGRLFITLIVALWVLDLLVDLLAGPGGPDPRPVEALILLLAAALPGGKAALGVLCVVLGAVYALAEARFRRFEAPARPAISGGAS